MKRYWKIMLICFVTLLVIGTFYIQSSLATTDHVKIEFEKVSGNESEVKNLMLYGDYLGNRHHQYQLSTPLQITSKETITPNNLSFLQKLDRITVLPMFDDLIKQHRNFMRGKDLAPTNFFEDENRLAYASINVKNHVQPMMDLTFDIEVLNKKSEEISSIQLDVPKSDNYGWMHVEDVQIIEDELKVITRGSRINSEYELRVYTFDMNEQKLITDHTIATTPAVENGWSDLRIINDYFSIQRNNYLFIKIEAFKDDMGHSDSKPNVANEFIVYDIENNQSKKIVGPAEILGSIGGASANFDSTIFIPSQSANGLEVNQYDIENDRWGEKLSFDLSATKDDEGGSYTKIMNGKVYTVYATTNGHTIFIGDLKTGEALYEGRLKVKNQSEDQKDFRLYFHDIEYVQ
jgi:hypothetical protein